MTSPSSRDPTEGFEPFAIDISAARSARIHDYLLGNVTNFAVDREHTEFVFDAYPGGIEGARADAWANRRFQAHAVHYLAADVGLRQFLDIGCGIPAADNAHAVALETAPDASVVYVDNDAVVLAHAHFLMKSSHQDRTDFVYADLRRPERILKRAAATLDLTSPSA